MNLSEALQREAAAIGLQLSDQQCGQLSGYLDLLQKWNRVYNLTAIRDDSNMLSQHLLDSLTIVPYLGEGNLLDVGSGAGLPGVPIAISHPQRAVTLVDSNSKKAAFMQQAVMELHLENVSVCSQRVETWSTEQRFALIISRAFAELGRFVSLCKHLLAPGGAFVAMKGVYPEAEIARLPQNFRVRAVKRVEVPHLNAERHLVWVESV